MKKVNKVQKLVEYEFHKWRRQLFVIDKVLMVLAILAFGFFRADYVVMVAYVFSLIHLAVTKRLSLLYHFILSSAMAVVLVYVIQDEYGYNHDYATVFGLNTFSLFGWAAGLFAMYIIYSHFEHVLKKPNTLKRFLLFTGMYWPILIVAETIGYYTFNIHNVATAAYAGLPLCQCMHAPWWMQLAYFSMGPLYILFAMVLKLENPHSKPKRSSL